MTTTWTIAIDWNRDGDYGDSYEDVTARVISANWSLGVEKPYVDITENSMLQLVLSNEDKRYSPENASSPLYGLLKPFRQVQIQSNDGTVRTHWTGWIEQIQPDVGLSGKRTIKITATGPTQFYKVAESKLALQENKFTDEVLVELIKEVVFPPGIAGAWVLGRAGNSEAGNNTYLNGIAAVSNLPTRNPDNPFIINVAGEEGKMRFGLVADNWVIQGGSADEEQRASFGLGPISQMVAGFLVDVNLNVMFIGAGIILVVISALSLGNREMRGFVRQTTETSAKVG